LIGGLEFATFWRRRLLIQQLIWLVLEAKGPRNLLQGIFCVGDHDGTSLWGSRREEPRMTVEDYVLNFKYVYHDISFFFLR